MRLRLASLEGATTLYRLDNSVLQNLDNPILLKCTSSSCGIEFELGWYSIDNSNNSSAVCIPMLHLGYVDAISAHNTHSSFYFTLPMCVGVTM